VEVVVGGEREGEEEGGTGCGALEFSLVQCKNACSVGVWYEYLSTGSIFL
jgi:hypothetical protein